MSIIKYGELRSFCTVLEEYTHIRQYVTISLSLFFKKSYIRKHCVTIREHCWHSKVWVPCAGNIHTTNSLLLWKASLINILFAHFQWKSLPLQLFVKVEHPMQCKIFLIQWVFSACSTMRLGGAVVISTNLQQEHTTIAQSISSLFLRYLTGVSDSQKYLTWV